MPETPGNIAKGPKLPILRNLADDARALVNGWYFRYAREKLEPDTSWQPIGSATTPIKERGALGTDNRNRVHNMDLACAIVSNTLIPPGYVFSLRKMIGRPIEARGFRAGPMLIGGELTRSVGGGLCQISSTLFAAALSANLDILERHNHSTDIWGPERFVDLGRDATYAWALKDLKFRNNHSEAVVLRARADSANKTVAAQLVSRAHLGASIRIESRILREIVPPAGDDGVSGWEVVTTRYASTDDAERITYRAVDLYQPTSPPRR